MKVCPKCANTYTDSTFQYCLVDGQVLDESSDNDEEITVSFDEILTTVRKPEPFNRVGKPLPFNRKDRAKAIIGRIFGGNDQLDHIWTNKRFTNFLIRYLDTEDFFRFLTRSYEIFENNPARIQAIYEEGLTHTDNDKARRYYESVDLL
jgi:hypothetical protein